MSHDSPAVAAAPDQPRPFQFHLGQLLIVIALLAIVLALTTQWKHIGFVLSCFIVGAIVGLWQRNYRLSVASLAGLTVYVATFTASWVSLGTNYQMKYADWWSDMFLLDRMDGEIEDYLRKHGEYPSSLDKLMPGELLNHWNRPLHYKRVNEGYDLISPGKDGRLGGTGLNADLYSWRSQTVSAPSPLALREFLFEALGSTGVFVAALVGAVISANLGWQTSSAKLSARAMLVATLVTTIGATIVAAILAAFYVAAANASPGH